MQTSSRHTFLPAATLVVALATGCAALNVTGTTRGSTAATGDTALTAPSESTPSTAPSESTPSPSATSTSSESSTDESGAAVKLRRSIDRTSLAIMIVARMIEKIYPEADFLVSVGELRKAMVLNVAAQLASKTQPPRVAMFLTLEARQIVRPMVGEHRGDTAEADPAEVEVASGGAGPDADRARRDADRIVPSFAALSDPELRQRTTAFPDMVSAAIPR